MATFDHSKWSCLRPADLKRLANFQFAAEAIVEGFHSGSHRSLHPDRSSEFAEHRPYAPGDELRRIDWKAFGRTDRLHSRTYHKEVELQACVLLDATLSMGYGDGAITKLEYAAFLAAAISYLAIRQGDRVGLALCRDTLDEHIAPSGTPDGLNRILMTLDCCSAKGSGSLSDCLPALAALFARRGLLVAISDCLEEGDRWINELGLFVKRGFAVLLFQVLTPAELLLPDVDGAVFTDPETARSVQVDTVDVRDAYRRDIADFVIATAAKARSRGIGFSQVTTATPYHRALEAYLTSRGRFRLRSR